MRTILRSLPRTDDRSKFASEKVKVRKVGRGDGSSACANLGAYPSFLASWHADLCADGCLTTAVKAGEAADLVTARVLARPSALGDRDPWSD